jgi:hypothetical protein
MSRPREGRLPQIAELVTKEQNGRFARTIVNRLWAKLMGRGLVEPIDTMGNRPWNEDVLDWLAADVVDHGYDLKRTLALIATSRAYQMESVHYAPEDEYVFRGPRPRRMSAEQLLDGIGRVTGAWQEESKFNVPLRQKDEPPVRAWRGTATALTRALGRPNREQVTTQRVNEPTTLQALELTNGEDLNNVINRGAESLSAELGEAGIDAAIDRVYFRALQRAPSDAERQAAKALLGDAMTKEGLADLVWSVIMLAEFQVVY